MNGKSGGIFPAAQTEDKVFSLMQSERNAGRFVDSRRVRRI